MCCHYKQMLNDKNGTIQKIALLFFPVLVILTIYYFSAAHPILYVMTICVYFPLLILLLKMASSRVALVILLLVTGLIGFSRIFPREQNINTTDLTMLSFYEVSGGEAIEQDFYLPESDWRLARLLNDSEISTVLRIIGNMGDEEGVHLYANGQDIGSLSQLLISKSDPMYSIPNASNYIVSFPKKLIENTPIISIRLTSKTDYLLGYNSGIAPLPKIPHAKRVYANGNVEDIASNYYHRRFRFSMVIYFVSKRYFSGDSDPLILGSIH